MQHAPRAAIVILVALLVSAVTWAVGWWGVVPVALVVGWFLSDVRRIAARTALGALLGWALLLGADALGGRFGALARVLSGTVAVPRLVLVAVTLAIPALLGWSAATLTAAIRPAIVNRRENATDA